ncbi:hypothetical protein QQ056_13840, partial [Oscillatoria laete-virens NRMC-F 0139]
MTQPPQTHSHHHHSGRRLQGVLPLYLQKKLQARAARRAAMAAHIHQSPPLPAPVGPPPVAGAAPIIPGARVPPPIPAHVAAKAR